jgi:hypothetical protein
MVLRFDPHNAIAMNNLAYMLAEVGIKLRQALLLATNPSCSTPTTRTISTPSAG